MLRLAIAREREKYLMFQYILKESFFFPWDFVLTEEGRKKESFFGLTEEERRKWKPRESMLPEMHSYRRIKCVLFVYSNL